MTDISHDSIKLWQPADGYKGIDERDIEDKEDPNFLEIECLDNCICIRTKRFVIDEEDLELLEPLLIKMMHGNRL